MEREPRSGDAWSGWTEEEMLGRHAAMEDGWLMEKMAETGA